MNNLCGMPYDEVLFLSAKRLETIADLIFWPDKYRAHPMLAKRTHGTLDEHRHTTVTSRGINGNR